MCLCVCVCVCVCVSVLLTSCKLFHSNGTASHAWQAQEVFRMARDREAAIVSEASSKGLCAIGNCLICLSHFVGLSCFEHSLGSLAAYAHNSNRRALFLGIVCDSAVCVVCIALSNAFVTVPLLCC